MNDSMIDFLNEMEKEIKTLDSSTARIDALVRLEETMKVYTGDDELISSLEILERIKTQPEEEKFMTGIEGLDHHLKGFRKNQVIVLCAPTKSGKTQFCVELTIRMAQTNPVWIPFEESAEELVRKFHDRKEEPPLFYTPKNITGNTLEWIEKRIVEGKVKYGSQLFFIDHLHFIVPFSSDRLDTRIGQVMRTLKTIAKNHGVTIVLVAHLKKTNVTVSPTLEDLRDSSFIAQEADTVLMLWRETKREGGQVVITNNTTVSIQANRRTGSTGNVKMVYKDCRFIEMDWKTDEDTGMCSKCGQKIIEESW
jgi:replicative DNA helicase